MSGLPGRRRYIEPKDVRSEPVCLLDKETAARRREPPDRFLAEARSQEARADGAVFRFDARPDTWERVATFVEEERECCPFFAFEQWEEDGEVVLRIVQPSQS